MSRNMAQPGIAHLNVKHPDNPPELYLVQTKLGHKQHLKPPKTLLQLQMLLAGLSVSGSILLKTPHHGCSWAAAG